jgi:hypothetical protein
MKDDPSVIAARKADQLQRYIGALEEKVESLKRGDVQTDAPAITAAV